MFFLFLYILFLLEFELKDAVKRSQIEFMIPLESDPGLIHFNSSSSAGQLHYEFDKVFDEKTTQQEVFETIAMNKVKAMTEGVNGTIFAYGQTGSGKTYSIFGGDDYKDRGIIPRSISYLFEVLKEKQNTIPHFHYTLKISFTEIYKEVIYDLLNENVTSASNNSDSIVQIYETNTQNDSSTFSNGEIVLKNLNIYEVTSKEEALEIFFYGLANRRTSMTSMNSNSSRSHGIFSLVLETEGIKENNNNIFTCGKLNFVDLAGSERMYKMANSEGQIKEAKSINLSLHYLEQVIVSLREQAKKNNLISKEKKNDNIQTNLDNNNEPPSPAAAASASSTSSTLSSSISSHSKTISSKKSKSNLSISTATASSSSPLPTPGPTSTNNNILNFIPYRNSTLTLMLRDSLGGNCRSVFLLTLNLHRSHFNETISTCKFGQRCGEIKVKVKANKEIGLKDQIKEYLNKIKMLEKKISNYEELLTNLNLKLNDEIRKANSEINLRNLTNEEKLKCKNFVSEIILKIKEKLKKKYENFFSICENFNPEIYNDSILYLFDSNQVKEEKIVQLLNDLNLNYNTSSSSSSSSSNSSSNVDSNPTSRRSSNAAYIQPEILSLFFELPVDLLPKSLNKEEIINELINNYNPYMYEDLTQFPKPVLIELTIALINLLQSVYIDNITSKNNNRYLEIIKKKIFLLKKKNFMQVYNNNALIKQNYQNYSLIKSGLPTNIMNKVSKGAIFIKHSRYSKHIKFIHILIESFTLVSTSIEVKKKNCDRELFNLNQYDS